VGDEGHAGIGVGTGGKPCRERFGCRHLGVRRQQRQRAVAPERPILIAGGDPHKVGAQRRCRRRRRNLLDGAAALLQHIDERSPAGW
jgi:hypothetical protein